MELTIIFKLLNKLGAELRKTGTHGHLVVLSIPKVGTYHPVTVDGEERVARVVSATEAIPIGRDLVQALVTLELQEAA